MSNNKHYHNYQNYGNRNNKPIEPTTEAVNSVEQEINEQIPAEINEEQAVDVSEEIAEEITEEIAETTEVKAEVTLGVVTGCSRLNVRGAATTDSDPVGVIEDGCEVEIDKEKSTADFYKICTAAGLEGFCMKKFIVIK